MQPVPQPSTCTWLWNKLCCCCPIDDTVVQRPPDPTPSDTQRYIHHHQQSMDSRIGRSAAAANIVKKADERH